MCPRCDLATRRWRTTAARRRQRAVSSVAIVCRRTGAMRGVTLLELLIAISITAAIAVALGGLVRATQGAFDYAETRGTATQHARVVLHRICRTVRQATANEQFPGFLVVAERAGPWRFPDTLVVWHPSGDPVDAAGLPRFNELVIYCPAPAAPNQLLELTVPNDTRTVPPPSDTAAWITALRQLKQSADTQRLVLTDLVRTATLPESANMPVRGAVRFEQRLRPSDDDWQGYLAGSTDWEELPWVQGLYGTNTGMRQSWMRVELQLVAPATDGSTGAEVFPFFGSAAVYYPMYRGST